MHEFLKTHIQTFASQIDTLLDGRPTKELTLASRILFEVWLQFLGKPPNILTLEVKSDLIKAKTGAFFTPSYICEYIVLNTIGENIKNLTKEEILNLKILDPACGGGIFLVVAHDFLMSHLEKTMKSEDILKENIQEKTVECLYGVDINPLCVEATKAALSLNCLRWQMKFEFANFAKHNLS